MSELQQRLKTALADRYAIEEEIGRGGMAVVFLAEDLKHGRKVALKVLRPEIADSIGADRFLSEVQITARLDHPHIVPLLDSGEADGFLYFVMPYVEGETLHDRLEREPQLPLDDALQITRELASALDYAHERGVVHRDLKPGNILLQSGHARLADFGIAHAVGEAGGQRLTATGMSVGTPSYMSPEQAAGDPVISSLSDIYSLGCVLYEMLAGQPPFTGSSARTVLAKHLNEAPLPVTDVRPNAGDEVGSALTKALEKVPGDRQATAGEFAGDLVSGAAVRPVTRRGRWRRAAVGFAAAIAVLLVAWWWATGQDGSGLRPTAVPAVDPNLIAIFPFGVAAPDTTLDYLAEEIAAVLGHVFDGVSSPRSVDPVAVRRGWDALTDSGAVQPTAEELKTLAVRMGAGQMLTGSLTEIPPQVRVTARIELTTVRGSVIQVAPVGTRDSLDAIIAELAVQLAGMPQGQPEDRVRYLLDSPDEARRAYLSANRARRAGTYEDAEEFYARALTLDPTFALAAVGSVGNSAWCDNCAVDVFRLAEIMWFNQNRLPPADRALIEGWGMEGLAVGPLASSLTEQVAALEDAVRMAPDRYDALFWLGDSYLHDGALVDIDDHSEQAWRHLLRAFETDSLWGTAHDELFNHLVDLAIERRDSAAFARFMPSFDREGRGGRFAHALMAADAFGDRPALDSLDRILRLDPRPRGLGIIMNEAPDLRAGYRVADYVEGIADGDWSCDLHLDPCSTRHRYALIRGRPELAQVHAEAAGYADRDILYAATFGGGSTKAAAEAQARLRESIRSEGEYESWVPRAADACALANLHLGRGEVDSARSALAILDEIAYPAPGNVLARIDSTNAYLCRTVAETWFAALDRSTDVDSELEALDARMKDYFWDPQVTQRRLNLGLAQAWEAAGHPHRALAATRRRHRFFSIQPYLAQSLRHEGRLAAAVGDTAGAIYAYEYYLELRSDPEPEMLPEVEEVRTALAALTGE